VSEELRQALGRIIKAGYQLSADGFEFLETLEAPLLQETVICSRRPARSMKRDRSPPHS
jgi:hypothetical protein